LNARTDSIALFPIFIRHAVFGVRPKASQIASGDPVMMPDRVVEEDFNIP
jgi:hypothetical protein